MPPTHGGAVRKISQIRMAHHRRSHKEVLAVVEAEVLAARPYVHGLSFRATFFRRVSTLWLPILMRLRLRLSVLLWCTSQHLHGARGLNKNFSDVTGDTVIFPATGAKLTFDVDLRAPLRRYSPATSASLPNSTTRCHSVRSRISPSVCHASFLTWPPAGLPLRPLLGM